jgi:predicted enzyme related to lactoylglutathione lyase
MHEQFQRAFLSPTTRGVHHLALYTDDMKATIDFYVEVLGIAARPCHEGTARSQRSSPERGATPMRASAGSG